MKTKKSQARVLAEKIAESLFTDGTGERAVRLQLKLPCPQSGKTGVHCELDGCGWGFEPAIADIQKVIEKHLKTKRLR